MSALALAPLAATIVSELPSLIERTLKHNVENNIVENQLVILQSQIDFAKRRIAAERNAQGRLRERIHVTRVHYSESASIFSFSTKVSLGNTSIPSIRAQPDLSMTSQSSAASHSAIFSDSPVSLRTKRKGIVFSDDVRIVKKAKITNRADALAKENNGLFSEPS